MAEKTADELQMAQLDKLTEKEIQIKNLMASERSSKNLAFFTWLTIGSGLIYSLIFIWSF